MSGAVSKRFEGDDGRIYVSINCATHKVFARACCDEWQAKEGVHRHSFLRFAKAISVPVEMLDGARKRLSPEEQKDTNEPAY